MDANDMLEYGDKIIDAFKNGTFLSEHLKKSDDLAHSLVLEDVNKFIQKIESIAEKINLGVFEDFFESSSPANYAKTFINPIQDCGVGGGGRGEPSTSFSPVTSTNVGIVS